MQGVSVRFFVKAKHWQLFAILVGCMYGQSYLAFNTDIPLLPEALTMVFLLGLIGWLMAIGCESNKRTAPELRASSKPMLFGLGYAAAYSVFFSVYFNSSPSGSEPPNMVILPFHVLAMACIFYSLGYTSKRLVTFQRGKKVGFFEYIGPFFLIWFFPIGIWFIQPKVNEMVAEEA